MEIREYWQVLRRRAWIPALLVVLTVLSAGAFSFLTKPQYLASATVVAKGSGFLSFGEVATSNTVALQVIQQLHLDESVDDLKAQIKVSTLRPETFQVSVTDRDPNRAVMLSNAVSQRAVDAYPQLAIGFKNSTTDLASDKAGFKSRYLSAAKALVEFSRQHPEAVGQNPHPKDVDTGATGLQLQLDERAAADAYLRYQQALAEALLHTSDAPRDFAAGIVDQAAARPDTGARLLKVGYAAALALIVGVGLIFLLEYLDSSVRDPDEVETLTGRPVIAMIPRATPRILRPAKGVSA